MVQKGGPSYSPAIVVYTLHSIIMVLLYYIYLLGTYHWLLSLILSVHFRNWMHLNINIVNIYIWLLATTRKLRKSPVFQFLFLAVNHFVLMAILNIIIYSIKHLQGMSILNAISIVYIAGEYDGPPFCTPIYREASGVPNSC